MVLNKEDFFNKEFLKILKKNDELHVFLERGVKSKVSNRYWKDNFFILKVISILKPNGRKNISINNIFVNR